jgi:hypothetical protein
MTGIAVLEIEVDANLSHREMLIMQSHIYGVLYFYIVNMLPCDSKVDQGHTLVLFGCFFNQLYYISRYKNTST